MLPMFLFTFPAGHVADNYDRKKVLFWMQVAVAITCVGAAPSSTQWIIAANCRRFVRACTNAFRNRLLQRHSRILRQFGNGIRHVSLNFL